MNKTIISALLITCIALLSGCGNGNVSNSGGTLKTSIKASSLAASQSVATIQLTITLPAGVQPLADSASTVKINSSAPSEQKLADITFTPATATAAGRLTIYALVASGFSPTEQDQISIQLDIAPGNYPKESDFALESFRAWDAGGVAVTLNPTMTTTIE